MKTLITSLRTSWALLVQMMCWVGVVIGRFVSLPARTTLTAAPDDALRHFAQFLGAVVLGIFLVACRRWQKKTDAPAWVITTFVLACITVFAFFLERDLNDRWTFPYAGHALTVASHPLPEAEAYRVSLGKNATLERVLKDSGGDASQVWAHEESDRNYRYLSACMIGFWIAAALSIASVSQLMRCLDAGANSTPESPV